MRLECSEGRRIVTNRNKSNCLISTYGLHIIATQPGSIRSRCFQALEDASREGPEGGLQALPGQGCPAELHNIWHIPGASTLRRAKFTFCLSVWKNKVDGKRSWGLQIKKERFQSNFFKGPFIFLLRRHLNLSDSVNHFLFQIWQCYSTPNCFSWFDGNEGGVIFHIQKFTKTISARASN